jgi:AbrB family looped-hinge helix DNA binding protein
MTRLKIHYDGWLALPAAVRRKLGLATGDELEVEVVAEGILLRTAKRGAQPVESEPVEEEEPPAPAAVAPAPAPAPAAAAPAPAPEPEPAPSAKTRTRATAAKKEKRAASTLPGLPPQLQARGRRGVKKNGAG